LRQQESVTQQLNAQSRRTTKYQLALVNMVACHQVPQREKKNYQISQIQQGLSGTIFGEVAACAPFCKKQYF